MSPKAPPRKAQEPETKRRNPGSWMARIKPDHPEYDPNLARRHFEMVAANGRKGAEKRRGVPRGWQQDTWVPFWNGKMEEARRIVEVLKSRGAIDYPEGHEVKDKTLAEEAITYCVAVLRSGTGGVRERLTAAKLILTYTKLRPPSRAEVSIRTAEDILALVADEANSG